MANPSSDTDSVKNEGSFLTIEEKSTGLQESFQCGEAGLEITREGFPENMMVFYLIDAEGGGKACRPKWEGDVLGSK